MAAGPVQVEEACESALGALVGAFAEGAVSGSREEWAAAVGAAQRVIDVACAAQDAAIARLAAIEPQWCEDGTLAESHRGLGHVALDAPAIVSGVLAYTAGHAESRVRAAVRLAGDGPAGSGTETGLGGLHAAMAAGRLDGYRAAVVADELEHAPAEVRATVVAALEDHFGGEDGVRLRRRCRRVLARISPDLLHQRAARARADSKLRRWADEPGVDHWEGTFPSEEAARAWAAIDALARQYVKDGECATIDRARARALTDLVAGNATITTVLTVTVPAAALPEQPSSPAEPTMEESVTAVEGRTHGPAQVGRAVASTAVEEGDLVQVTGPGAGEPVLVSRRWLSDTVTTATVQVAPCHPATGALLDHLPPPSRSARHVNGADRTIRTHRTARLGEADAEPAGLGIAHGFGATAYTPSKAMAKRIRARDRRCRFPGCSVAAVFCDLDHVRPWPAGPTHDTNLLTVCRRHHRVKQRPGWAVTLTPDGVAIWIDPTGRARTSHPVDALTSVTLTGPAGTSPAPSTSRARTLVTDGPHTELEYRLEHHGAPPPGHRPTPPPTWRDDHGHTHRIDLLPSIATMTVAHDTWRCHRRRPRAERHHDEDPPPF
jgi:hypothetical protein